MNIFSTGLISLLISTAAFAQMPNPQTDPNFLVLNNGTNLKNIEIRGRKLALNPGNGARFTADHQAIYEKIKRDSKASENSKIHWVLMDLDSHQIIDQSANPDKRIFGASNSKIFVGATLVDKQNGNITPAQLRQVSLMLVVSDNTAWHAVQAYAGDGDEERGRANNLAFTQRMGYLNTRGYQGQLDGVQGNHLTAKDTAEFLYDTYHERYPGAEVIWKVMHACRTGEDRGSVYMPTNIFVGGKTGTYAGRTSDWDGKPIVVDIVHHSMVFKSDERQYALTMLTDTGNSETLALLAGGLVREYILH